MANSRLQLPAIVCFQARLQHRQLIECIGIARACCAVGQCVISDQIIGDMAQPARDGIEHGLFVHELRLLQHKRDHQVRCLRNDAVIFFRDAGENFQQARFASAVTSDQGNAFAGFDGQFDVIQKCDVAIGQRQIFELKERHDGRQSILAGG